MPKKRDAPPTTPSTAKPSKHSLATSSKPIGSLASSDALSPSTGDAVAMVEAFLAQDDQNGASSSSASVLPPEKEDSTCPQTVMPRDKFCPTRGADYTESFVSQLRDELRMVGEKSFRKVPLWAVCLEQPTRQRLVFRDEFITKRNTVQLNFGNYRRAMQIYRVGAAQRVPCDGCKRGLGPFRRCVVDADGDALKGACANCSFREHGYTCRYHQKFRKQPEESSGKNAPDASCLPPEAPINGAKNKTTPKSSPESATKSPPPSPPRTSTKKRKAASANTPTLDPPTTATKKMKRPKTHKAPSDPESTPALASDIVLQATVFTAGQASAEQVSYILRRCDANQRAFFTGAWLSWCSERDALGRPRQFDGIEAFLSKGWYEDLNEMISKVCPVES